MKAFYLSFYNWKLIRKIDILRFFLKSAFRFSFSHNGGLVQRPPYRSLLKDQDTWFIDEYHACMDTLCILCRYLLMPCVSCVFLLERFDLLTKSVLKKCMCCKQCLSYQFYIWLRRYRYLLETFENQLYKSYCNVYSQCLWGKKVSNFTIDQFFFVNYGGICFLNLYHDNSSRYMNMT